MNRDRAPAAFAALAGRYDELRPADAGWWEIFEALIAAARIEPHARALDIGCGTGRFAHALAERGVRVWGVDASAEMLAEARAQPLPGGGFKQAPAERLPFKDGWFDAAVLRQSIHLVERPAAFREVRRILVPGGRVAVATFHPGHFDRVWISRVVPEVAAIDRARFPDPETLRGELGDLGFTEVSVRRIRQRTTLSRDEALARLHGRYISTLHLVSDEAYRAGVERAEALPETVESELDWAIVAATAP